MAKHRIYIRKTGDPVAVCNGVFENIDKIGKKHIERAADVEFNNDNQTWEIIDPKGEILGSAPIRADAIAQEVQIVDKRLRESIVTS